MNFGIAITIFWTFSQIFEFLLLLRCRINMIVFKIDHTFLLLKYKIVYYIVLAPNSWFYCFIIFMRLSDTMNDWNSSTKPSNPIFPNLTISQFLTSHCLKRKRNFKIFKIRFCWSYVIHLSFALTKIRDFEFSSLFFLKSFSLVLIFQFSSLSIHLLTSNSIFTAGINLALIRFIWYFV